MSQDEMHISHAVIFDYGILKKIFHHQVIKLAHWLITFCCSLVLPVLFPHHVHGFLSCRHG